MKFDHVAVSVQDIARSVEWYVAHTGARVLYQDETWAMLDAGGAKVALTLPHQHPAHVAFDIGAAPSEEFMKKARLHRDGSLSRYVVDPDGNAIEWIHYPQKGAGGMNVYVLRRTQTIPRPLDAVFAFFARPENLERISPEEICFTILTPGPIEMKAGALIDYTIRLMGVPMRWTTLITTYDPPRLFVDEQIRGPYSFWHHRHTFRETDDGTEIIDEVHYALRGGVLAPLIHRVFVRKQLDKIFDHRARIIARELMGTGAQVGA